MEKKTNNSKHKKLIKSKRKINKHNTKLFEIIKLSMKKNKTKANKSQLQTKQQYCDKNIVIKNSQKSQLQQSNSSYKKITER